MATRLDSLFVMLTISRLCLLLILFGYYDSSLLPDFGTPMLYDSSRTRTGSSYTQSSIRLLTLTQLDDIHVSYFYGLYASLYLYLPYLYIYWVGDGTPPIFNLLCNHPSVVT